MNRNEARRIIMIILYQAFMYDKNNISYDIDELIKDNLEIDNDFVKDMVHGVIEKKKELEKKANDNLNDWKLSRLGFTDQAILLLGLYELLYTDTPDVVAINEAVELAKKYSDDKVKNMINGVLDKVYHEKIA
ncbi:MAG TPA: transcription antitermination factor NusB [Candidatus Aphodocola excrementigallinarum]|uniref:Transcription antitermination protein NusB n=1 Tax=Candidatus Aphodocola excrementigallinarum TaxID=2840670 RepID=A0A9D1LHU8_9FIRM|nr:transcription antitermination factor NusB [Candidatus Aphodocola excrementigallinarum]